VRREHQSEIDGTGCASCQRFFHDACVREASESERSETYRDAAAERKPRKKRKVRCPGCGADVRRENRERDRAFVAERERLDENRRVALSARNDPQFPRYMAVRAGAIVSLLALALAVRLCGHG
jgi:hypothetical protein